MDMINLDRKKYPDKTLNFLQRGSIRINFGQLEIAPLPKYKTEFVNSRKSLKLSLFLFD